MPAEIIDNVTASYLNSQIDWSKNSGQVISATIHHPLISENPFQSNRQFIKLEQAFLNQLDENAAMFDHQNKYSLQEKMKISAEILLDCMPDKISLQITEEGSIFYTVIMGHLRIYFEHFLIEKFDDSDEAIITIFNDDENILSHAGSLLEIITELANFIPIPQLV